MNKLSALLVAFALVGPAFAEATLESHPVPPAKAVRHAKAMHGSHRPKTVAVRKHAARKPAGTKVSRVQDPDFPWVTPS